jgi:hypothetical protein
MTAEGTVGAPILVFLLERLFRGTTRPFCKLKAVFRYAGGWTQASRCGNTYAFATAIFLFNLLMQLQCLQRAPDAGSQKKPLFLH